MLDAHAYLTSTGWRLICWSPSLSAVLFSSCSRSQYRGTVTSSSHASPGRKPSELQSQLPAIPPCGSYAEVARIFLTLISLICAWKGKTWRHNTDLTVYSPKRMRQAWRHRLGQTSSRVAWGSLRWKSYTRKILFVFQESSLAMNRKNKRNV